MLDARRPARIVETGRLEREAGAAHMVMMGFSQGACLTVEYALRHPGKCRTLVVLTGWLFGSPGTVWQGHPEWLQGRAC